MTTKEFIINHTIKIEGGYVNDPDDDGGGTKYGITEKVARMFGYKGDMEKLSKEEASRIYDEAFWQKLQMDEIKNQSVAHLIFDIAVNSGTSRSAHFVQRVCTELGHYLKQDGKFGPNTREGINEVNQSQLHAGLKSLRHAWYRFLSNQPTRDYSLDSYFRALKAAPRNSQRKFYNGWVNNRVTAFKYKP